MDGELNNLSTNNTEVTFTNNTNNLATSDELSADPLYYRQMGTAYSAGKWVKGIVIGVSITLTVSGGVVLANTLFSNSFVKAPSVESFVIKANEDPTKLDFSFSIKKNEKKYTILLTLKNYKNESIYSYRAKEVKDYSATITDLTPDTTYNYKIVYTNDIDLVKDIKSGEIKTMSNIEE